MRPSSRTPTDLRETLDSVLARDANASAVLAALARTIRANIPQQRDHPSHEVIVDDWAHAFALAQNRRLNHALKQSVLTVARKLDDAGLGRLRLGRRGKKTRFSLPPHELSAWLDVMSAFRGHDGDEPSATLPGLDESPSSRPDTDARRRPAAPEQDSPPTPAQRGEARAETEHQRGLGTHGKASGHRQDQGTSAMEQRGPLVDRASSKERARQGAQETSGASSRGDAIDAQNRRTTTPPPQPTVPDGRRVTQVSAERLTHRFMVRPGVEVSFELPVDFSVAEAKRFAHFVTALPFDWDQ